VKFLNRHRLKPNPVEQFAAWYADAKDSKKFPQPDAMCVSNVDTAGKPDARMVLLKRFDDSGFVFYTNLDSPKARGLKKLPHAALTFYWDPPGRQVRITGRTERVPDAEADAYFATRDRLSQIGAWASDQSAEMKSRVILVWRVAKLLRKFRGKPVPRPPNWSGFRVVPDKFEFWQPRPFRLNDRFVYRKRGGKWVVSQLFP
jgi:pyridoxamine 5'-phosphate oxidase